MWIQNCNNWALIFAMISRRGKNLILSSTRRAENAPNNRS